MEYLWRVYLDDGSIITEGEDPNFKSSEDFDKRSVARIEYVNSDDNSKVVSLDINIKEGERFYRFWRKTASFNMFKGTLPPTTVYVIGIKKLDESILTVYLYADGQVLVSTNDQL